MTTYDAAYAKETGKLDYFREYAEDLLKGEDVWGLFAVAFGKSVSIKKVDKRLKKKFVKDVGELKEFVKEMHKREGIIEVAITLSKIIGETEQQFDVLEMKLKLSLIIFKELEKII